MTTNRTDDAPGRSLAQDWLHAARYYLGTRRTLLIGAALIAGTGVVLNWSWLAAAGVAPLIISFLPCAAMCALGLCMHGKQRQERSDGSAADSDEQ